MLSDARLQEIAAVTAAATPGPWFRGGLGFNGGGDIWCQMPGQARSDVTGVVAHIGPSSTADADAAFIADARQAVPELLAEVQRLRGLLTETTEALASSIQQVERLLGRE